MPRQRIFEDDAERHRLKRAERAAQGCLRLDVTLDPVAAKTLRAMQREHRMTRNQVITELLKLDLANKRGFVEDPYVRWRWMACNQDPLPGSSGCRAKLAAAGGLRLDVTLDPKAAKKFQELQKQFEIDKTHLTNLLLHIQRIQAQYRSAGLLP
ncbi:MAG: hypothetical protein ACREVE_10540 [Gammaproteobacteria bacterium]